ncbi:MAG: hypothetical protein KDD48_08025 [Bdellovibrionales bacterium]|nr:hypothetical protein [Bdellovibrionales bacterium]
MKKRYIFYVLALIHVVALAGETNTENWITNVQNISIISKAEVQKKLDTLESFVERLGNDQPYKYNCQTKNIFVSVEIKSNDQEVKAFRHALFGSAISSSESRACVDAYQDLNQNINSFYDTLSYIKKRNIPWVLLTWKPSNHTLQFSSLPNLYRETFKNQSVFASVSYIKDHGFQTATQHCRDTYKKYCIYLNPKNEPLGSKTWIVSIDECQNLNDFPCEARWFPVNIAFNPNNGATHEEATQIIESNLHSFLSRLLGDGG